MLQLGIVSDNSGNVKIEVDAIERFESMIILTSPNHQTNVVAGIP